MLHSTRDGVCFSPRYMVALYARYGDGYGGAARSKDRAVEEAQRRYYAACHVACRRQPLRSSAAAAAQRHVARLASSRCCSPGPWR